MSQTIWLQLLCLISSPGLNPSSLTNSQCLSVRGGQCKQRSLAASCYSFGSLTSKRYTHPDLDSTPVWFLVFCHTNSPTRPNISNVIVPRAVATATARRSGDPELILSSLAILHERFAVLQCTRERRERKELMMYFAEPDDACLNGTFPDDLVRRDQTELSDQRQIDYHQCLARQHWKSLEGCFLPPETSPRRNQGEFRGVGFREIPPANKRPKCSTGQEYMDVIDTTLHL